MRVLLVCEAVFPDNKGGIERWFQTLGTEFHKLDNHVTHFNSAEVNETRGGIPQGDGGFRTMNFGPGDMDSIAGRTAVADKMGYGDLARGPQPTGLGVNTGVAEIDKALNRDYSELVKRFKKK